MRSLLKNMVASSALITSFLFLSTPSLVAASSCPAGQAKSSTSGNCEPIKAAVDCASGKVDKNDKTKCAPLGDGCPKGTSAQDCLKTNNLVVDLNNIIKFLSAGVGIVIIAAIIIGGIQYSLAGGNETAVAAAKKRIINALIALAAFLFTFSLLEWLIPGGL